MAHFIIYFLLSRRRATSKSEFISEVDTVVTVVLLRDRMETGEPLRRLPSDKQDFCKQQKMPPPCDVLGCCRLCLRTVWLCC